MNGEDDPAVDVAGLKKKVEALEYELKVCKEELQKLQSQLNERQQPENTDDYKEDLRQQVKKLSAELYAHQKQEKKQADAETQTDHHIGTKIDYNRYGFGDYHSSEAEAQDLEDAAVDTFSAVQHKNMELCQSNLRQDEDKECGNLDSSNLLQPQAGTSGSIAEMLRATAEEALSHTGFVFDENSGMYYDHNTGFFYDSVNQLYYDANTGIYYYYDADSGKYQFYSRIPSTQTLVQDYEIHDQTTDDKKSTISDFDHEDEERTREGLMRGNHKFDTREVECQKRRKCATSSCRLSDCKEHVQKIKTAKESSHEQSSSIKKKCKKKKRIEVETNSEGKKKKHKKTGKEKKKHRKQRRTAKDHSTDSELEDGEIATSEREESISSTSSTESRTLPNTEEVAPELWPPCVRVTVVRSPALHIGSLFILTADTAATIGREKDLDHAVRIPEAEVSKSHAEVYFDEQQQCYMLVDLGSQNGTVINGNRIFQPKVRSDPCPLSHGDEVKMGETVLSFHIHPGTDTCDGCEPGQIIAHLSRHKKEQNTGHVGEDKEVQRQRELNQMKVKYGLKNSDYGAMKALDNPKYKDRAKTRRGTVGSEGPFYRDDSPSSVHVEISEVNKGRKILEKMGWKRGEGLGKDGAGMKDPIQLKVWKAQSGFGSSMPVTVDNAPLSTTKSHENWKKAHKRFNEVCQPPSLTCSTVKNESIQAWVKGESTD